MAPLNICWGEAQFPYRVTATGGKYVFNAPGDREVPDTMNLLADFAKGHSLVLSATIDNVQIKVEDRGRDAHMKNFLECIRTREKPRLDADTAYRAQVTISMGVMALRQGKVLYFDPDLEEVTDTAPRMG